MGDKEILRGFCGAILRVPLEEIEKIELLPKQLRKKYKEEKIGELQRKLEMDREMLKDNMPIEKVAKYARLSVEEIQKLM